MSARYGARQDARSFQTGSGTGISLARVCGLTVQEETASCVASENGRHGAKREAFLLRLDHSELGSRLDFELHIGPCLARPPDFQLAGDASRTRQVSSAGTRLLSIKTRPS